MKLSGLVKSPRPLMRSIVLTLVFPLTFSSNPDEFCRAVLGPSFTCLAGHGECHSKAHDPVTAVCCDASHVNQARTYRAHKREKISEIAGCVSMIQYVLNLRFDVIGNHLPKRTFHCSRQGLAHSFSIQLLLTVLEVMVKTPTMPVVGMIDDRIDPNWLAIDLPLDGEYPGFTYQHCATNLKSAESGEWQSQNAIPMSHVDSLLHFCSIAVVEIDDFMRIPNVSPAVVATYAKAYLRSIAGLPLEEIVQWGHLPKVLAQFIHMAAKGVVFSEERSSCHNSMEHRFVPEQLDRVFGI